LNTVVQPNAQQHSVQYTITRGTVAAMEKSIRNSKAWNEAERSRAGQGTRKGKGKGGGNSRSSKRQKRREEVGGGGSLHRPNNLAEQHSGATRCQYTHTQYDAIVGTPITTLNPNPPPFLYRAMPCACAAPQSLLNHSHTGDCPSFQPLPPPPLHHCTVRHRRCHRRAV